MKRVLILAVLGLLVTASAMFADVEDYMININGTTYCASFTGLASGCGSFPASLGAIPGTTSTIDESLGGTGLGQVQMVFNPGAPGSYYVDLALFEELFVATGQNEYGTTGGSAAAGQSWQIDTPDYDYVSGFDPNFGGLPSGAGKIFSNTAGNTLADKNYVTGNTAQDTLSCSGKATCNDYTALAMGFGFTLAANQEELLTFTVSTTKPTSGFYLEQIAPVDKANTAEIDYFLTGSATAQTVGGGGGTVPEPSSLITLLGFVGALGYAIRRRRSTAV